MKSKIIETIRTFKELEHDWDGYGGIPLLNLVYINTVFILLGIKQNPTEYYPNPHGTCSLEYQVNEDLLFIEIGMSSLSYMFKDQWEDKIPFNGETLNKLNLIIENGKTNIQEVNKITKWVITKN